MTHKEKLDAISVLTQTVAVANSNSKLELIRAASDKIIELIKTINADD